MFEAQLSSSPVLTAFMPLKKSERTVHVETMLSRHLTLNQCRRESLKGEAEGRDRRGGLIGECSTCWLDAQLQLSGPQHE